MEQQYWLLRQRAAAPAQRRPSGAAAAGSVPPPAVAFAVLARARPVTSQTPLLPSLVAGAQGDEVHFIHVIPRLQLAATYGAPPVSLGLAHSTFGVGRASRHCAACVGKLLVWKGENGEAAARVKCATEGLDTARRAWQTALQRRLALAEACPLRCLFAAA